jgi:dUTP pyrophosphatase
MADQPLTIPPGEWCIVPTSIAVQLPPGTYGCITPRSGLAAKKSIDIGASVVDSDYTGKIKVLLINHADTPFEVNTGDHMAQLIMEQYLVTMPTEVNALIDTTQGSQGFGSTGIASVDLMPSATEATLKSMITNKYQKFLDVFDPSGPTRQLPPL